MTGYCKYNFIGIVLFFSSVFNVFSQEVIEHRQKVIERVLPAIVVENFHKQYPDVLLEGWYETHIIHWQNDLHGDWYDEWYIDRTIIIYTYEKPSYYEVEFIDEPGEYSRAIYNIHGYWHETRTKIKGLPRPIVEALQQSKYKDWNLSVHMEKMDSPAWPDVIYRFQVKKALKAHILSMDSKGNMVQSKIVEK